MTVELVLLYIALVNSTTVVAFVIDKNAARNGTWRISEAALLRLAFIGGTPGALIAQRAIRHKTRKEPFRSRLLAICAFHIVCAAVMLIPGLRALLFMAIAHAFRA